MPRFFSEVENGETVYEDRHGEFYPNTEAALRGAQRLADELAEQADEFAGSTVLVLDEAGAKIGRFFIRPPKELLQ